MECEIQSSRFFNYFFKSQVFTLFVEEPSRHLILIRFYDDFVEFDKRVSKKLSIFGLSFNLISQIKDYSKRCKIPLPKLLQGRCNSITSIASNDSKRNSSFRKILHSFSHKSTQKSNSDNIERYLRHCVNDLNIQSCSLFKEFLQPQREEDNVIPKHVIESYVQQASSLIVDQPITPSSDTTTQDDDSYTSFPSHIMNNPITSEIPDLPATIQDFQLIKVIGRGCMGKVSLDMCVALFYFRGAQ